MVTCTADFYDADFMSTLFPLKMNAQMIRHHGQELNKYIYGNIFDAKNAADNFLPQQRVYATKPKGHLRRTVKLDPVAEYFIYDVIYRNRSLFRGPVSAARNSFGYRFENGMPIPVNVAYRIYKQKISECKKKFGHFICFDIASYFNSLYHHDLNHWFESQGGVSAQDLTLISRYFREINSGRSIDFLPQGIYPTKMIGSEFLKFLDLTGEIRSATMLRFMDDFYLFDDSERVLMQDFIRIQQLIGSKALNINPTKTKFDVQHGNVDEVVSDIKRTLFEITNIAVDQPIGSAVVTELVEVEQEIKLDAKQIETLLELLKGESLEEGDADLILSVLRSHSDSLLDLLPSLLARFPNITKHINSICAHIQDKESLSQVVLGYINSEERFVEYQLFWLAVLCEEQLGATTKYGDILWAIYQKSSDFKIARAKVLEIPEQGFGFKGIRDEYLKSGSSDWLSWSSAFGSVSLKPAERNYVLDYFSKGSPLNFLVASCVKGRP